MGTKALEGYELGLRNVARRIDNAINGFLGYLQEQHGLSDADARIVYRYFHQHKLIKIDAVNGSWSVKHGRLLDRDAILRAIELSK